VSLPEDIKRASEKHMIGSSGGISSFMFWRQSPSTSHEVNINKVLLISKFWEEVANSFNL
jgi:hypothetical protein